MRVSFQRLALIIISSGCLFFSNRSISQPVVGNEPLAIEYFKQKRYDKALPIFTQLINKSPGNAMYNYYYGVSLLKNHKFATATKEALLNAVVDKTPSNANFYLANYFHALENWPEAYDFYKRYKGSSQERKELEYDKYFDMCLKRINPFTIDKGDNKVIFVDTIKTPAPPPDEKNFPIPDSLRTEWFNFQINSQLIYHGIMDFRSEAAKILFTKAWIATGKNDSVVNNTDILRKAHEETHDVTTRIALVQRIVEAEQLSYQLLREREKYFEQARVKEAGYWEKAGAVPMSNFIKEIDLREKARAERLMNEQKKNEVIDQAVETEKSEMQTVKSAQEAKQDEIIYKIQIGSFLNGRLTPAFKTMFAKLSKLRKIDKYTDSKNNVVYTIGYFNNYKDAALLRKQLILEGTKGCFLAAFKNGERVPVNSVTNGISPK